MREDNVEYCGNYFSHLNIENKFKISLRKQFFLERKQIANNIFEHNM